MPSDDLSFLTNVARQYMFGRDTFSDFMCKAVAIIKSRIEKYRDVISLDLDDLIQEGLLQAFEAFEYWKKNGGKDGKAAPHSWTWLYVETRFRSLAEANVETYVDDESLLDGIMDAGIEDGARGTRQGNSKGSEKKKGFCRGIFFRIF